ncbi:porin [Marinobacter mobilis]|uniref:porin n=1 Tax=Marinobacter mobilis TaxID=488533 RepID=UPI0035C70CBA
MNAVQLRLFPLLIAPALAHGHAGESHVMPAAPEVSSLSVDAGFSTTYRTGTVVPTVGVWQIPGVLMGADAYGASDTFNLDGANIHLKWHGAQRAHASLDIGSHHDGDVALEEALAGYRIADPGNVMLEAGRMKARFSAENRAHAYTRPFSENNLIYDAFYGAHYVDEGARVSSRPVAGLELGVEAWRGGHYPATEGKEGMAQDAYAHWYGGAGPWVLGLGAWVMLADASERPDDRLVGGHSHTVSVDQNADLVFSGQQDSAGARLSLLWQGRSAWSLGLTGEVVKVEVDGELRDRQRQAHLEGDSLGWWLQPELRWQQHALAVRYVQLVLDNHLVGAGGPVLAEDAGFLQNGTDPDWLGVSYRYQLQDGFGVRAEWTRNRSTGEAEDYLGFGIYWAHQLWSSTGG